ncbi:MAG: Do family serine endopeptidase [Desulfatitalea sp.]|nr:Do family serine endopeptidase [Desulfatitalea sp.]NNK02788.1 Do family serine endopeptidase [Desulfatitalea sp.]
MSKFSFQIKRKTRMPGPVGRHSARALIAWIFVSLVVLLFFMGTATAFDRRTPVVTAVDQVGPAVVNISSEYEVHNRANPFGVNPFFDNFFNDFFDTRPQKRVSLGSGVIIDGKRGFVLTNAHVIDGAAAIRVTLKDERHFDVTVVGSDPDSDLAVLRIDSKGSLPAVAMGDSDQILIGETIIAIGNPFGFSHTVTTGVVSAVDRSIKTDDRIFNELIQTDASINPGNSGGPLLNINGELIGINTAIYAKAQGIGFAIPINQAKRIVADLIQYGHVIQAWIGLIVQDLDARMASYLQFQEAHGVLVTQLEEGSPAATSGLETGDIITAISNSKIASRSDYLSLLRGISAGDKVTFNFWRGGTMKTLKVKTSAYPQDRVPQLSWRRLGLQVGPVTRETQRQYGISAKKGVVVTSVRRGSYLSRIGVAPGDVILQLDDLAVSDETSFAAAMIQFRLKSALLMLLQRGDQLYHLNVRLAP